MTNAVLTASDVSYGYSSERTVLRGISAAFEHGALCGIIGPNGCGKTTLLKLLSGEYKPTSGHVLLDGRDTAAYPMREKARRIAVVPQSSHMDFDMTALDVVLMGRQPYLRRFERETDNDIAIACNALERTDMLKYRDTPVTALSGGEMQRVIISRALAQQTDVMLLDEPSASLDLKHAAQILSLIRALTREKSVCGVCVLHDLSLAGWFCDKIILMNNGEIYSSGSPADVLTFEAIRDVYGVESDIMRDGAHVRVLPRYE